MFCFTVSLNMLKFVGKPKWVGTTNESAGFKLRAFSFEVSMVLKNSTNWHWTSSVDLFLYRSKPFHIVIYLFFFISSSTTISIYDSSSFSSSFSSFTYLLSFHYLHLFLFIYRCIDLYLCLCLII